MHSLLHVGDRVTAINETQGLRRGRPYHVVESKSEWVELKDRVLEIPTVKLTSWPEPTEEILVIKCSIVHLKLAVDWTLL